MRWIILAISIIGMLPLPALASAPATQFCGDRYGACAGPSDSVVKVRIAKRQRGHHAWHRMPKRVKRLAQHGARATVVRAPAMPAVLAKFSAPVGAVCAPVAAAVEAGVNILKQFRERLAQIVEPVRPGYVWIRAGSGARAIVAIGAADNFVAFIRDLEATGYRIAEMGGYSYRRIAGTRTLSKHAFGNAVDINQERRNVVSVRMDRRLVSRLAAKNGLCSGGDWRNPDLGHIEVCGRRPPPVVLASAEPAAVLLVGKPAVIGERTIASVFNDRHTACPPYHLRPGRLEVAHRSLPCGTRIHVVNLRNGRMAEAVVADIGPCTTRRCLARTPRIARQRHIDFGPAMARAVGAAQQSLTPIRYSVAQ